MQRFCLWDDPPCRLAQIFWAKSAFRTIIALRTYVRSTTAPSQHCMTSKVVPIDRECIGYHRPCMQSLLVNLTTLFHFSTVHSSFLSLITFSSFLQLFCCINWTSQEVCNTNVVNMWSCSSPFGASTAALNDPLSWFWWFRQWSTYCIR